MLPTGAAQYTVTQYDSAVAPGYYFMGSYRFNIGLSNPASLMVLDAFGYPVFYKDFPVNGGTWADLRVYPNGLMSYYLFQESTLDGKYYIMDSTFTVIDSVACGNGLKTDGHEMLMLDNGHYYLICLEERIMDLSGVLTEDGFPGSANGTVLGPVIQELDENKNVIFEWLGIDYYSLNDIDSYFFLDPSFMDFGHPNGIAIDQDGNLLFSVRFFNEITKISRVDSSIIWRLGGKQNDFTFINDSLNFSAQHNIEVLPNGNITLYDNGELTTPPLARGVEYELDQTNKTATRVWSLDNTPGVLSYALGSMQRLSNGNSLVSWGAGFSPGFDNDFIEVSANNDTLLTLDYPQDYFIYRTYKSQPSWDMEAVRPAITCDTSGGVGTLSAETGLSNYQWNTGATSAEVTIADTGAYYYYTQEPNGYFFAKPFIVTDINNPCNLQLDTISDTLSVLPLANESTYQVYPNPATDQLIVIAKDNASTGTVLRLLNGLGQTVKIESILATNTQIDLADLNPGLYLGVIETKGQHKLFKLLIQR